METRQIVIIETKNQRKSVINSSAETLAELKADLNAAGIDYTNMTFYEGTSKTELKTNDSILPKDVPYKGTITNNLVFMLTNINKKIESGMVSRTELYADIKKLGLQEECKRRYGKNFTQCKTDELKHLIDSVKVAENKVSKNKTSEDKVAETSTTVNNIDTTCNKCIDVELRKAFSVLLSVLDEECVISSENINVIEGYINTDSVIKEVNKEEESVAENNIPYSQDEIDEMFNKMF